MFGALSWTAWSMTDVMDKAFLLLVAESDYLLAHDPVRVRPGERLVIDSERVDLAKLYLDAFGVDRIDVGLAGRNVAFGVEPLQCADQPPLILKVVAGLRGANLKLVLRPEHRLNRHLARIDFGSVASAVRICSGVTSCLNLTVISVPPVKLTLRLNPRS